MSILDFPPSDLYVKEQLKLILASTRFQNAGNPAAFLDLVVRRKLAGKLSPGRIIAEQLFGKGVVANKSNDVRVTASNLRKTLDKYYAHEGAKDIVIISLPAPPADKSLKMKEGEAYAPIFEFNPRLEISVMLRLAYQCLERWTYHDFDVAYANFAYAMERFPEDPRATLGLVETLCNFAERDWHHVEQRDPATVPRLLAQLHPVASNYWRFWAVRGFFEMILDNHEQAGRYYNEARRLDRIKTEGYRPYITHLLETQRVAEGLVLVNRYMNDHLEDSSAHAAIAGFMIKAGQCHDALKFLEYALIFNRYDCGVHYMLALIFLAQKKLDQAYSHLQQLKALCDPHSFALTIAQCAEHEEEYAFKGWTTQLLGSDIIESSVAIAKR